jgi:large subunit ribosomal protein L15
MAARSQKHVASSDSAAPSASDELSLSTLKPASPRKARKRVGRGMGSGKGRYAGRGVKGQKARAGSHRMRAGFEGGQMPVYMRMPKQRGSTSKDAMPIGPHRTVTQSVNVRDLERVFDADSEITPEALEAKGLIRTTRIDVKILGHGELTKKLSVAAHRFSASAREKIEAAGGTAVALREVAEAKSRKARKIAAAKRAAGIPQDSGPSEPEDEGEAPEE